MVYEWTKNHDTVWSVAAYAVMVTMDLTTADEVLHFFGKPWRYPELYEKYRDADVNIPITGD